MRRLKSQLTCFTRDVSLENRSLLRLRVLDRLDESVSFGVYSFRIVEVSLHLFDEGPRSESARKVKWTIEWEKERRTCLFSP